MMASKSISVLPMLLLQIIDALKQCSQVSDFNNYLAFILAQGTGTDALVEVSSSSLLYEATLCWLSSAGTCPPQDAQRHPASLDAAACNALTHISRLVDLGLLPRSALHQLRHMLAWQVRQAAGLLLKNNLKTQYQGTPADLQSYIKVGLALSSYAAGSSSTTPRLRPCNMLSMMPCQPP